MDKKFTLSIFIFLAAPEKFLIHFCGRPKRLVAGCAYVMHFFGSKQGLLKWPRVSVRAPRFNALLSKQVFSGRKKNVICDTPPFLAMTKHIIILSSRIFFLVSCSRRDEMTSLLVGLDNDPYCPSVSSLIAHKRVCCLCCFYQD